MICFVTSWRFYKDPIIIFIKGLSIIRYKLAQNKKPPYRGFSFYSMIIAYFTLITTSVRDVIGVSFPIACVVPFDSVFMLFCRTMPVALSIMILPVVLLFRLVMISIPAIISILELVVEVPLRSTTMVESVTSLRV